MTLEELLARMGEIGTELEELNAEPLDDDGEERFEELSTEFKTLDEDREKIVARNAALEVVREAVTDPRNVISNGSGDP